MKVGDKVYCKKSYLNNTGFFSHLKDKIYIIDHFDRISFGDRVWIKSEPDSTPLGYLGYVISGELYNDFHYFTDYFLSPQEVRKLKIKKLNESRR